MASEFQPGDLVWAKMKSYPWWPAVIGEPKKDVKKPPPKKPSQFVVFFGTDNYSWIANEFIKPYAPHVEAYSKCSTVSFKNAMKSVEDYLSPPKAKSSKPRADSAKANGVTLKKRIHVSNKALGSSKSKKQKTDHASKSTVERRISEDSDDSSLSDPPSTYMNASSSKSDAEKYLPLLSSLSPFLGGGGSAASAYVDDNYDWTPRQSTLLSRQVVDDVVIDTKAMGEIVKPPADSPAPSQLKLGFLGLGIMGTGIARHLVNAGYHVTVYNRNTVSCFRFQDAGIQVCKTAGDVVDASDIIFSCVSDSAAANEIVFGKNGVLGSITENKGYVEITSIDPKTSKDIQSAIAEKRARYLEAPVIGSRELCVAGQLVILAAGDSELFKMCEPMFGTFAKHAFYLGEVGNAAKMNILVNMLVGTSLASFAESLSLAERVNISQENLLDIVKLGPLRCPLFIEKAKAMMERNFSPSIRLQHVQKDLHYALQLGDEMVQPLPITSATNEVFKHAKSLGYATHDVAAVYNARF